MTALTEQFQSAVTSSKQLTRRPDNGTMLRLYALYKQGTEGDAPAEAPADMVGRFKHRAWAELAGTGRDAAQQQYVDLVASLHAAEA